MLATDTVKRHPSYSEAAPSQSQKRTVASVGAGFLAPLSLTGTWGMLAIGLGEIELIMTPEEDSPPYASVCG